jgi:hypothetical protein
MEGPFIPRTPRCLDQRPAGTRSGGAAGDVASGAGGAGGTLSAVLEGGQTGGSTGAVTTGTPVYGDGAVVSETEDANTMPRCTLLGGTCVGARTVTNLAMGGSAFEVTCPTGSTLADGRQATINGGDDMLNSSLRYGCPSGLGQEPMPELCCFLTADAAVRDAALDTGADTSPTLGDSAQPLLGDSGLADAPSAADGISLCSGPVTSDLPGVSFDFPDDRCTYTLQEVAKGIVMRYELNILQSLAGIHPTPTDYGGCQTPDASGLIVGFEVAGSSQRYCLCDVGPCMRQTFNSRLLVGTHPGEIRWDGRNWLGSSDTGNPEGAAFPVGTYTLTLTALGTWDGPAASDAGAPRSDSGVGISYQVTAKRFITITP